MWNYFMHIYFSARLRHSLSWANDQVMSMNAMNVIQLWMRKIFTIYDIIDGKLRQEKKNKVKTSHQRAMLWTCPSEATDRVPHWTRVMLTTPMFAQIELRPRVVVDCHKSSSNRKTVEFIRRAAIFFPFFFSFALTRLTFILFDRCRRFCEWHQQNQLYVACWNDTKIRLHTLLTLFKSFNYLSLANQQLSHAFMCCSDHNFFRFFCEWNRDRRLFDIILIITQISALSKH